jgi:hypothetical protein
LLFELVLVAFQAHLVTTTKLQSDIVVVLRIYAFMGRVMAPWQHLVRRLNLYMRSPAGIERQGYIMVGLCCAYPIGYTLKNLLIAPVFFSRHVIYDPNGLDAQVPEHVQAIADEVRTNISDRSL